MWRRDAVLVYLPCYRQPRKPNKINVVVVVVIVLYIYIKEAVFVLWILAMCALSELYTHQGHPAEK